MPSDVDVKRDAVPPSDPSTSAVGPRSSRASPRLVLLWAIVAVLVALGLYAAAPWLLPLRIVEGPLVQLQPGGGLALVWYTSRPGRCTIRVDTDDGPREFPVQSVGRRHRVPIDGLAAAQAFPYEVRCGVRPLTRGLYFQMPRRAGERYCFFVFGDSGKGNRVQYRLAQEMERASPAPDFLLHTGDLIYPDGARRRYEANFFAPYRVLLARVPFLPCLGNHDVDDHGPAPYLSVFVLPANGPAGVQAGRNYWVDYADARIVVIDSTLRESDLGRAVAPWLQSVLSGPGPRWRFVAFHHPPFTGGKYPPDVSIQRTLVPVIDDCQVDVVFNGHDHSYQRTHPMRRGEVVDRGTVYIITAAGGARLYEPKGPRPAYVATLNHSEYSFTRVDVEGTKLTLSQISLGGRLIDEYVLEKPREANADADAEPSHPHPVIETIPVPPSR